MKVDKQEALKRLSKIDSKFLTVFEHGSLALEVYKPKKVGLQTPHARDEVYIVLSGKGTFYNDGVRTNFTEGYFLFVKTGLEHRFENFTDGF